MTNSLRIGLAQLNPTMGDLAANSHAILAARAAASAADIILTPPGALTGWPLADLGRKPAFAAARDAALARLAAATGDGGPALLIPADDGAALLAGGRVTLHRGESIARIPFAGQTLALAVGDPPRAARAALKGSNLLIIARNQPFHMNAAGPQPVQDLAAKLGLPVVQIGRVGGQDDLVFAGGSMAVNADGRLAARLPDWEATTACVDWRDGRFAAAAIHPLEDGPAAIYHACVTGLRDYVARNRFPGVVLGLSGGLDSALVAAIAVDALGADRLWCVMLPSPFTSAASLEDASQCAAMLGCRLDTIPITPAAAALDSMLAPVFAGQPRNLAEENIQSRLRMVVLMALSNKFGHMLLSTGNKSEVAVGYATIYGDMAGGYNVLKDLYKTEAFALARWRNAQHPRLGLGPAGPVMPERIITKPPSAELRADQRDDDSLPPYDQLDAILRGLVDEDLPVAEVAARGFDAGKVAEVEQLVLRAEYKRQQAAPGVRLTERSFASDRRYPVTNAFRTA